MAFLDAYERTRRLREEVCDVIEQFVDTNKQFYGSHSYNVGYLGSMVSDLLSKVSKADREYYLEALRKKTEETKHEIMINSIKNPAQ
jgi:hypothetical protein